MPILTETAMNVTIPKFIKVKQQFDSTEIKDIKKAVTDEFLDGHVKKLFTKGSKVAVAVGSRGIYAIDTIVKSVINNLKSLGAEPFIVPSMGSHGGASAEGQRLVLKNLGIDEITMGVPVVSSLEVVKIGETDDRIPVFMDKNAYEADTVVLVARIKPHTDFKGKIESGLCKMMAIGLGKHEGCSRIHQEGFDRFHEVIPDVAEVFLKNANIGLGMAILENGYDKTAMIKAVHPKDILEEESKLLLKAKSMMPRIYLSDIDVLVVEQIGKEISGAGMDPNIVGRTTKGVLPNFDGPRIQRIVVTDLSEKTHGNACGIGLADFVTKEAANKIDYESTYANVIASGNPEAGRLPVVMNSEVEAIKGAISCCAGVNPKDIKIVRIKDTLHLSEIFISENLKEEIEKNEMTKIID